MNLGNMLLREHYLALFFLSFLVWEWSEIHVLHICALQITETDTDSVSSYVVPTMGTGGLGYGCGSTYPGASIPFGNVRLSPDTTEVEFGEDKHSAEPLKYNKIPWRHFGGYYYKDPFIACFSHTHMVGSGILDMGNFALLPSDNPYMVPVKYEKESETANPGYYSVNLSNGIEVELTATQLVGYHRYSFSKEMQNKEKWVSISSSKTLNKDACKNATISMSVETTDGNEHVTISGFIHNSGDYSNHYGGYDIYMYAEIVDMDSANSSKTINENAVKQYGIYENHGLIQNKLQSKFYAGKLSKEDCSNSGVAIQFNPHIDSVSIAVAISFISIEQAKENLKAQLNIDKKDSETSTFKSFDMIRQEAATAWEAVLSLVRVDSDTNSSLGTRVREAQTTDGYNKKEKLNTFYTSLFKAFQAPSRYDEANGMYCGIDQKIHQLKDDPKEKYFSDMSIWDTHRTQAPLMGTLVPDIYKEVLKSVIRMTVDGGDVPRWPFVTGYTGGMTGNHAFALFADDILKSKLVDKDDLLLAYPAMVREANNTEIDGSPLQSPVQHNGRKGVESYKSLGYVPLEEDAYSASLTLAYAYDDHSLSTIAMFLGYSEASKEFLQRSDNYLNVFDTKSKFFCPRYSTNGTIFCPKHLSNVFSKYYVEGNAWHYRWWVPHDLLGLKKSWKDDNFYSKELENFFQKSHWQGNFMPDIGYWAGNEPDLLTVCSITDLSRRRYWIRNILKTRFSTKPDGIPGNDDYGTMSSWYFWQSIGLYPITGLDLYAVGVPSFNIITLNRPKGVWNIQCDCCEQEDLTPYDISFSATSLDGTKTLVEKSDKEPFITASKLELGANIFFTCQEKEM